MMAGFRFQRISIAFIISLINMIIVRRSSIYVNLPEEYIWQPTPMTTSQVYQYQFKLIMQEETDFQQIAAQITAVSSQIINLISEKTQFAKSISYQLNLLFQYLGQVSKTNQIQSIDIEKLKVKLSERQKWILYNTKSRNKGYLIPEDICQFLHVSKQHLTRNHITPKIQNSSIQQFYSLLRKQQEIENSLVEILKEINLEKWFAEVDFFNNGYIDTAALYEYLLHYSDNITVEEYNALLLIRMIKKHTHSDKIFQQDVQQYLQEISRLQKAQQFTSHLLQRHPSHLKHRVSVSAVEFLKSDIQLSQLQKKLSYEIPLEEDLSIFMTSFITDKKVNEVNSKTSQLKIPYRDTQQLIDNLKNEDQIQPNITYQERLVLIHPRNERYITRVKRQMSDVLPICRVEVQSHLLQLVNSMHEKELLDRLRLLAAIYNKKCKEIEKMITSFEAFNFFNIFEVIDFQQKNQVSYQNWLLFMKQRKVTITNKRVSIFFERYSHQEVMRFSQFVRIFRLKGCSKSFQLCQARKPSLLNLEQKVVEGFCIFMHRMMKYIQEQQHLVEQLKSKSEDLKKINKNMKYVQQYINLLGQQYEWFLRQHFQDEKLVLWK